MAKRTLPFPHTPAGSAPLQLLAGYDPNQYFPGFPSFFHLNFMYERTQAGVCIFQFPSRGDSLIVQVHTPTVRGGVDLPLSRKKLLESDAIASFVSTMVLCDT